MAIHWDNRGDQIQLTMSLANLEDIYRMMLTSPRRHTYPERETAMQIAQIRTQLIRRQKEIDDIGVIK